MKTSVIASICVTFAVAVFCTEAVAREKTKAPVKTAVVDRELRINEIISCGYAYAFITEKNGDELLCYGEINKMSFNERTNCHLVKATFDKVTGRPSDIVYLKK